MRVGQTWWSNLSHKAFVVLEVLPDGHVNGLVIRADGRTYTESLTDDGYAAVHWINLGENHANPRHRR